MPADPFLHFRAPSWQHEGIRTAARYHGRSVSGELRAAVAAHLEATVTDLKDDGPADRPGRVTSPPVREAERAPA